MIERRPHEYERDVVTSQPAAPITLTFFITVEKQTAQQMLVVATIEECCWSDKLCQCNDVSLLHFKI